jgi:hypothetical protein
MKGHPNIGLAFVGVTEALLSANSESASTIETRDQDPGLDVLFARTVVELTVDRSGSSALSRTSSIFSLSASQQVEEDWS